MYTNGKGGSKDRGKGIDIGTSRIKARITGRRIGRITYRDIGRGRGRGMQRGRDRGKAEAWVRQSQGRARVRGKARRKKKGKARDKGKGRDSGKAGAKQRQWQRSGTSDPNDYLNNN